MEARPPRAVFRVAVVVMNLNGLRRAMQNNVRVISPNVSTRHILGNQTLLEKVSTEAFDPEDVTPRGELPTYLHGLTAMSDDFFVR